MSEGSINSPDGKPLDDASSESPFSKEFESSSSEDLRNQDELPQDPIVRLQSQLEEANNRLLRSQAELDNFRKRSRREMEDQRLYAQLPMASDLLAVVDNLERAIEATGQAEETSLQGLKEGVVLVMDQLKSILQRHHCQRIEVNLGDAFDPNCHEAISQQPSEDYPTGTVLHVTQSGYQLRDRIVRPVQVVVSTGPVSSTASP